MPLIRSDVAPALLVLTASNEVHWANQEAADLLNLPLSDLLSTSDLLAESSSDAALPEALAEVVHRARQTGDPAPASVRCSVPGCEGAPWRAEGRRTLGPNGDELLQLTVHTTPALPSSPTKTSDAEPGQGPDFPLFEGAQDPLFLIQVAHDGAAPVFRLLRLNPAFERTTGRTTPAVRGKPPHAAFPSDAPVLVEDHCRECVATEGAVTYEQPLELPDGPATWDVMLSPVHTDGRVTRLLGIARDLTKRAEMEATLRKREQHLAVTLDSIADAVVVTDANGRVTRMNRVAEILTEWSADDARGQRLAAVLRLVDAGTGTPIESPVEIVRRSGKTVGLADDTVLIGKQGTERRIADSAAPIYTEDGTLRGVVMVFRDMTAEHERRRALQASEERWHRLVEQSPVAIYVTVDWTLQYVNEAAVRVLGGNRADDLLGRSTTEFVHPDTVDESAKRRERLEQGQPVAAVEKPIVRLDGEERTVVVQSVPIRYDGEPAVQTVIRDVTERRRIEAQLHQAQRMETVGTLAGGIAHDFNNILHSVQAYLELVSEDLPGQHPVHTFLSRIKKGLHRAGELVDNLLTFSRPPSHQKKEHVVMADLIRDTLDLAAPSLPRTVEVYTHFDDRGIVVGDEGQLKQVLMNLVTNAGQAMEGHGPNPVLDIALRTVEMDAALAAQFPEIDRDRCVCLTVSDTGPGIDEATQTRIFDPFFTTKETGEGTGLGLSVVHGIVKGHGGDITVRSRKGDGTTFDVYLPAAIASAPPADPQADDATPRGHVMVVDDEEQILHIETVRLQRLGYEASVFQNGRDALQAYEADPDAYDAVLTDYIMPLLSGLHLARALRAQGFDRPILLMSGYSAQVADAEVHDAGVDAFLRKPVETEALRQTLGELLE